MVKAVNSIALEQVVISVPQFPHLEKWDDSPHGVGYKD